MKQLLVAILDDCGYRANPYFSALRDGSFARDDFLETQIQFYFAVVFFSRPMAALGSSARSISSWAVAGASPCSTTN